MTAAFQGNAFQPNAFQMGSDGVAVDATQHAIISDGNDAVMFLHEQDQRIENHGSASGPVPDADEECLFPVITSVTAGSDLTTGTSHVVTFTASVGDGVLVVFASNGNTHTATAGWTEVVDNESVVSYWRVIDGTEGGTMTITSSANSESVWYVYRIQGGTFDPSSTPSSAVSLNDATQNPPNLNFGWDDKTLVLAAIAGDTATSPITFTSGPSNLTNGFVGQETGGTAVPDCYLAVGWGNVDGSSFDPNAFSITAQSSLYDLATIAIRGNCRPQLSIIDCDTQDFTDLTDYGSFTAPLSENGAAPAEDFLLGVSGLDTQDFTDLADYGSFTPPLPGDGDCILPAVTGSASGTDIDTTSVTATLPSGVSGDLIVALLATTNAVTATTPTGWSRLNADVSGSRHYFYRYCDGTEGGTQVFSLGATSGLSSFITYRVAANTYTRDSLTITEATATSANPNPPSVTLTDKSDRTLWIAVQHNQSISGGTSVYPYPNGRRAAQNLFNAISACFAATNSLSEDPGTFTIGGSALWVASTISVSGVCPSQFIETGGIDTQDFTDLADYGSFTAPLSEDGAAPAEDFLLGVSGLDDQDFTDLENYGAITPQPISDNNPEVAPSSLDDQDFTDLADYGYVNPQAIENNNPDVSLAAVALDTQDFTDLEDYGFIQNGIVDLDEQDPDLGQVDCDSQDWTDLADYGSITPQAIEDNNPEIAPSSLDDQDFTDLEDYGFTNPQAIEDFVLREDFILGDGKGLDTQDFTDEADYGSVVAPLAGDVVDFLLGTGDGLDTQDFTDLEDYGYVAAPLSGDNNPEVAPSDLDTQDFTDLADYGSVTPQAIADNNGEVAPSSLDDQDFTDTADYGLVVAQAIPDNNPELAPSDLDSQDFTDFADYGSIVQQAIEDNNPDIAPSSLDDQDFTDLADYGSVVAPLSDNVIVPEDFILGDGKGLDSQDFTDFADYGFINVQPFGDVTYVIVNGVQITVSVGCFHVYGFGGIPDPTTVWSTTSTPTATWGQIADPTTVWTQTSDGSSSWTGITDPSDPGWEEDC